MENLKNIYSALEDLAGDFNIKEADSVFIEIDSDKAIIRFKGAEVLGGVATSTGTQTQSNTTVTPSSGIEQVGQQEQSPQQTPPAITKEELDRLDSASKEAQTQIDALKDQIKIDMVDTVNQVRAQNPEMQEEQLNQQVEAQLKEKFDKQAKEIMDKAMTPEVTSILDKLNSGATQQSEQPQQQTQGQVPA